MSEAPPQSAADGTRALIIERDPDRRATLSAILENWHIHAAPVDAGAAIDVIRWSARVQRPFSFALLNLEQAVKEAADGPCLVARLRAEHETAEVPLILVGERALSQSECDRFGAFASVEWPVPQSQLLQLITGLIRGRHSPAPAEKSLAPQPQHHSWRILLVEDIAENQELMTLILEEKHGHRVRTANNGREAVEAFGEEPFDLILMDIQMPEMGGIEATKRIRLLEQESTRTPIIALTANAMKGDREIYLAAEMDGYVSKPVRTEELLAEMSRVMADGMRCRPAQN